MRSNSSSAMPMPVSVTTKQTQTIYDSIITQKSSLNLTDQVGTAVEFGLKSWNSVGV
jgi:hypothetical protein